MSTTKLPKNFGVVLFPGFQLLDVCGPIDALNVLSNSHTLNLSIIAAGLEPVGTQHFAQDQQGSKFNQSIVPTHTFDNAPQDLEVLIIPGGLGNRSDENMKPVVEYLTSLGLDGSVLEAKSWPEQVRLMGRRRPPTRERSTRYELEVSVLQRITDMHARSRRNTRRSTGWPRQDGWWMVMYGQVLVFLRVSTLPLLGRVRFLVKRLRSMLPTGASTRGTPTRRTIVMLSGGVLSEVVGSLLSGLSVREDVTKRCSHSVTIQPEEDLHQFFARPRISSCAD